MAVPPSSLVACAASCGMATAGWLRRFWSWTQGGYGRGVATPVGNHRGWLWPLGRLAGLLPISFKECGCATRAPFTSSRAGSEHAVNDAALPTWDVPHPGRTTASKCSCVVAERSLPWLAYSFAVVLILVPSAVFGLCTDAKNASTKDGKPSLRMQGPTDVMVTFCDILSVSLCSVVCFAQLALTQATLFEVLDQLQQVDRSLSIRPPAVPGMLALWLVMLTGVVFMDGYMWTEISQNLSYAATYFPFYIVYFLTFVMEVLFIDDAHGIYMRFAALNEKLDQALTLPTYQAATAEQLPFGAVDGGWIGEPSRTATVSITGIAESNGMFASKAASNHSNGRRARLRPAALPGPGLAAAPPLTVQRLNMAHHVLCETSTAVARRYGLCLLVDMPCILLHLVITAYFFLKQLMASNANASTNSNVNTTQYVVVQSLWLAVHLVRLLMIVLPCSKASVEANRTGALVGVVLSTAPPYTVAHKQLESFSIQLLHHKVNFNACGLFELGLPLVVSILGAVTTYLVVLLQLKGNPASNATNSTTPTTTAP